MSRGVRVGRGHFDVMHHRSYARNIDGNSQQAVDFAREIVRHFAREIIQPRLMLDRFRIRLRLWQ